MPLDPHTWQPHRLTGAEYAVTRPATGDTPATARATLATVTLASEQDVEFVAGLARTAQRSWADAPHFVRAAVLRRAGDLFAADSGELRDWIVRESGSVPDKASLELHVAAQE